MLLLFILTSVYFFVILHKHTYSKIKKGGKMKLEEISLWYRYKTAIWNARTPQANTVHNIMRVLRSIHFPDGLVYISTPITSGKVSHERDKQTREMIYQNYSRGWKFFERLKKRMKEPILFPADLVPIHQEWEQDHFMALWLSIISEKTTKVAMNNFWEYANGSVEEFVHIMQLRLGIPSHKKLLFFNTKEKEQEERKRMRNISVEDYKGKSMSLCEGYEKIQKALIWTRKHGLESPRIERSLNLLEKTKEMLDCGFYQ